MGKWLSSNETYFVQIGEPRKVPDYVTTYSNTFEFDPDNLKDENYIVYNNKKDINMDKTQELVQLYNELAKSNVHLSKAILDVDIQAMKIMVERNNKQKYKEAYALAGIQGVLFQVLHKAERLKSQVLKSDRNFAYTSIEMLTKSLDYEGNWKDDFIHGNLVDLRNYCTLALGLFERYKKEKDIKHEVVKG